MRPIRHAAFAIFLIFTAVPSIAQSWPQRTVHVIVPNSPGSAVDLEARLFAEGLAERWHQAVVVENRPGADGIVAATGFVNASDNHTLLFSFAGVISINPLIHETLPYDPSRDIVPISSAAINVLAIAATESLNVHSLAEFLKLARSQPDGLNWAATPGLPQYAFAALQKSAGLSMHQIAYRDFSPALQDFSKGRIQVLSTSVTLLLPLAGKATILLVTTRERSPLLPEVPTARETGYPELTFEAVVGFFGWRDIPEDLKDRIAADVRAVAMEPAIGERLVRAGAIVHGSTPPEFSAAIDDQRKKVAAVIHSLDGKLK